MPSAEFEALRPQLEVIISTGRLNQNYFLHTASQYVAYALEAIGDDREEDALAYARNAIRWFEEWQHG